MGFLAMKRPRFEMGRLFQIVLLCICLGPAAALGQQGGSSLNARFDQMLSGFDPAAVAAARSYAKAANMHQMLDQMVKQMTPAMVNQVRAKNPKISEENLNIFMDEFMRVALVDNSDVLEKWTLLNMLRVFSTDELVALDQFWNSDMGRRVMTKMPTMMANIPELIELMQKYMIPDGLAAAQAKLKALGRDIKI